MSPTFLAGLDKVQEDLLYYPRRRCLGRGRRCRGKQNVKVLTLKFFYVMGKALSGELSGPCDRSCFIYVKKNKNAESSVLYIANRINAVKCYLIYCN